MEKKKPSNICCVCNQAIASSICEECPKYRALNPEATYYNPLWLRKLGKYREYVDDITVDNGPEVA